MKYYLLLLLAVVIGQLFTAAVSIWIFQKDNPNINYFRAVKVYFNKELATFVVIFTFTLLLMFILSDWMDLNVTQFDLRTKTQLTKFEAIQAKYRTYAALYGVFAQSIALLFFRKGKQAIQEYGKKQGFDDDLNKN